MIPSLLCPFPSPPPSSLLQDSYRISLYLKAECQVKSCKLRVGSPAQGVGTGKGVISSQPLWNSHRPRFYCNRKERRVSGHATSKMAAMTELFLELLWALHLLVIQVRQKTKEERQTKQKKNMNKEKWRMSTKPLRALWRQWNAE